MRNVIQYAAMALIATASTLTARQLPPANQLDEMNKEASPQAHQAIAGVYGKMNAKTDFFAKHVVNGVTVWEVNVKTPSAETTAVVTDGGEFIMQGFPAAMAEVPKPVQNTVQDLLRTTPQNLSRVKTYEYLVTVKAGENEKYDLHIDAAGRVIGAEHFEHRHYANPSQFPEAQPADRQALSEVVARDWPGAQVREARLVSPEWGIYYVAITEHGANGWAEITRSNGFVSMASHPLEASKLPAPVTKTMSDFFKADQIVAVHDFREELFDAEQTAGGETINFLIHRDGLVEKVRTRGASEAPSLIE